ncbi:MAG: hypothetical protein JSW58_00025 [Candidatus Latescibacterota bacterium]|nr:MAG: hypothetical protein JSW58_00025 [Candidatus Latescibacterota bacterium]
MMPRVVLWLFVFTALAVPGVVGAGELVKNGSFETGDFGPYWVHGAFRGNNHNPSWADHIVVPDLPFTGGYSVRLGFKYSRERRSAVGYMYQDVTIPADVSIAQLSFKVRQQGYDTDPFDPFSAQIRDTNDSVLQTLLGLTFSDPSYVFKDSGWIDDDGVPPLGFDMIAYAGQTVRIYFEQANTNDNLWETWAYVDDVSLIYRKFVDLAIDGNGDDQFGAIGSGDGGMAQQSGTGGDTFVFDLNVENEGLDSDTYNLTATAPPGWSVQIDPGTGPTGFPYTTNVIASGDAEQFNVIAVPPPGVPTGYYDIVVDAVSTVHGNRFDSVRLGVSVLDTHYGTDLVVDGNGFGVTGDDGDGGFALKIAPWDSTVTYAIELINTGDGPAAFEVSSVSDPGASGTIWYEGTPYTTSFNTQVISPGATATMTLEVTVPTPEPGDDYQTIVRAVALPDTLKKDTIKAILRLRAPRVDMIVGSNGNDIYDDTFSGMGGSSSGSSESGVPIVFPVTLQNESNSSDSFEITWVRPRGGWNAVIVFGGVEYDYPFTTPVLAPYSQIDFELKIQIPGNAKVGTYSSYLNAVSLTHGDISESVTAAVSVIEAGQIDLIIDGSGAGIFGSMGTGLGGSSTQTIAPGDSGTFTIELQNLSGADAADISWNTPPGWQVTFDDLTSPIYGYPSGVYILKVVVPASAPSGPVDIIVDAQKTDRRFYMDSVLGRVYVAPKLTVDALIDGNGDGIYGSLGTGLGGSSIQTHSAPASLSFTIELQNEGTDVDQYTVTWSDIPFWQATLNGSGSPYTTSPVAVSSFALLTFDVGVPFGALPGDYSYIVDVRSNSDSTVVESIEASITVVGPPRADLLIDGNGAGEFGAIGSGDGGTSVRAAGAGTFYTSVLEVRNVGSFADSFFVAWEIPAGWPAGSVVIDDGTTDHASPFWTTMIGAGVTSTFTVEVQVPASAGPGSFATIINSFSSLLPNFPESVKLVTQTSAVVTGVVFDDRDHDGAFGAQDIGLGGVRVKEVNGGLTRITGGDGRFVFEIASGVAALLIEENPSGFVSISPDTVGPVVLNAGDTLTVNFADVPGLRLSPGTALPGVAGAYVDFPHRLDSGTKGTVSLSTVSDSGVVTMFLLDENENGQFDGTDRAIVPGDLDMDPATGKEHLALLLRVFVPMSSTAGTTLRIEIDAIQSIDGTPLTIEAQAMDAVVVIANDLGRMALEKQVDTGSAMPGDVLTYTISYFNAGVDSVQNILIVDPVSSYVDPLTDAFGPGQDVEWQKEGAPVAYLTLDPTDPDECEYSANERMIRLILSKNTPYYLLPGETGTMTYRVIVK